MTKSTTNKLYKRLINHEHVNELVVQANKSDNIHEVIEHYKRMSIKSERRKNDFKQACLDLGVNPAELQ